MKKLAAVIVLALLVLPACAQRLPVRSFDERDYQWHKNTIWIRVHWNYSRPDDKTIVATGYVEPFSARSGVYHARLELVGLDSVGNIVNRVSGRPEDNTIVSPFDKSPFSITMELTGKELDFTIAGDYYYFIAGSRPSFSTRFHDTIPVMGNEPY